MTIHALALALALCAGWASVWAQPTAATRVLDTFADIAPWHAGASDGVHASIHSAAGPDGRALRLDFDLGGTGGYAVAARSLPLDLPPNYEIAFDLRADAPINNFQVKLVDESDDNVWWFNRPDFTFPREWRRITIKKRQIDFAWGPTKDRQLKHAARIEFVVAAGEGGGAGFIEVSGLTLAERPLPPAAWPTPLAQASSSLAGSDPRYAVDGQLATAWRSDPAQGLEQQITLDFGMPREFGGLMLRWQAGAFASHYDVAFSDDGRQWRTARSVTAGGGGPDALLLPDAEARYVRLALHDGPARSYALAEIEVRDLAFGASPNAFFEAIARESPLGTFPRGFSGQQSYWTIVGVDGGHDSGLLSEDGTLEVAKGGFSIEPIVRAGDDTTTWADVQPRQSLLDRYLPIPSVEWRRAQWSLRVTAFAAGAPAQSQLVAGYEIRNLGDRPLALELVLAIRPSQVNPPAQFLNAPGGVSPIRDIAWDRGALTINGARRVFALDAPENVGAFVFDQGPITRIVGKSGWSGPPAAHDPFGYASAALGYRLALAPRASRTIVLTTPLSGATGPPIAPAQTASRWFDAEQSKVAAQWRAKLDRVAIRVPASAQPIVDTMRTALAHILITRDGPILRPGTRAYARSWIRDGAMMSEALLRMGHADVAADYLRWYAPHQFANGKIPCCVDRRGADPVPENDSEGEFIFLADAIFRYTGDRALLDEMWPRIAGALRYQESLRQSERIESRRAADGAPLYGLLPASISHEGYSEKPMHSYWDDFWALKGYNSAIDIAEALGKSDEAARWRRERDEFRHDLAASLLAAASEHRIDYLPGAAELGDFDPTSSSIAFAPAGDSNVVPPALIVPTFERYWREFRDRRDGRKSWDDYTPYELRLVSTFVRLAWRAHAHELLAYFMADRRPQAWNQWAEVVGRDPRKPRFVGDMPHGWIASDFIRAALDLFAYERDDRSLVLAAGVPAAWLDGAGIAVSDLPTPYGPLRYSLRRESGRIRLHVDGATRMPPRGFVFAWPLSEAPGTTRVNGRIASWADRELRLTKLPADVIVDAGNAH